MPSAYPVFVPLKITSPDPRPHVTAIPIALLLVPSFLLWGMVRAAFKVEPDEESLSAVTKTAVHETLKVVNGSHPLT